jgi:hypothetical protein
MAAFNYLANDIGGKYCRWMALLASHNAPKRIKNFATVEPRKDLMRAFRSTVEAPGKRRSTTVDWRKSSRMLAFAQFQAFIRGMSVEMSSGLQFTGWFGELKTVIAKKLFLRSSDYVDINNVTIRTRRGTTQIDHVIVSRYGVFVVETKNMSGWIFGRGDDPFWSKTNRGNKLRFQNPLHQNASHIRALSSVARIAPEKMHSLVRPYWKLRVR